MADAITIKALQDASLDAKSLEEVVNGNDTKQVTTRLGANYPSVKKAIKALFENGGLPATPFKTKALMTASALANDKYAMVTDGGADNGLYVKTAGVWVKSAYDPVLASTAKTREILDAEVFTIVSNSDDGDDLLNFTDGVGNIYGRFKADGGLYLNDDFDDSVQSRLQKVTPLADFIAKETKEDLYIFRDGLGRQLFVIDSSGHAFFMGSYRSVQEIDADLSTTISRLDAHSSGYNGYSKTTRKFNNQAPFTPIFKGLLDTARVFNASTAPVPMFLAPQDYEINDTWINDLSLTIQAPEDRVVIDGYDPTYRQDIGVVHPFIIAFAEKVAGYRYWMVITPYTDANENIEIPFMYGSNDDTLHDWKLISGFPAPFERDPNFENGADSGHLSDCAITYDPINGDIVCYWRYNLRVPNVDSPTGRIGMAAIHARSYDGKSWSDIYDILPLQGEDVMILSPSIIFNPDEKLFYMYTGVQADGIYYRTSKDIQSGVWSPRVKCTLQGFNPQHAWHFEVKFIGKKAAIFIQVDEAQSQSGIKDDLFFGLSDDFKTFVMATSPMLTNAVPSLYKASFLPVFTAQDEAKFKIVYTTDQQGAKPWYLLHVSETNTVNIGI